MRIRVSSIAVTSPRSRRSGRPVGRDDRDGLELGGATFTALIHPGMCMNQKIHDPVIDMQMRHSRIRFGAVSVERKDDLRGMVREIRWGTPFFYLQDSAARGAARVSAEAATT